MLEIFIAIGAGALVVFTVIYNLVRRKKGKSSGGCESSGKCGDCTSCAGCSTYAKKSNKADEK